MKKKTKHPSPPPEADAASPAVLPPDGRSRAIDLVIIAIIFLVALARLWPGIPEPLADWGRELYVPWQISEGRALYRDLAYYQGPLAPQVNATLFGVFGVSSRVVLGFNVMIAAAVAVMLYVLICRMADRFSAVVGTSLYCLIFAFSQLLINGNYNFLTPYSHDLTYGFALSLAALLFADESIRRRSRWLAGAVGVLLGLVALTKPEMMVAATAGVVVLIGSACLPGEKRWETRWDLRRFALLVAGVCLPPLAAWACMSLTMSPGEAFRGAAGGWYWLWRGQVAGAFYQHMRGTDQPIDSAMIVLRTTGGYAIMLAPAVAAGWFLRKRDLRGVVAAIVAAIPVVAFMRWGFDFRYGFSGLLVTTWIAVVALGVRVIAKRGEAPAARALRAGFAFFAAALLSKILLDVQIVQYGFVLALPAFLLATMGLLTWLPALMGRLGRSGLAVRVAGMTLLVCVAVICMVRQEDYIVWRIATIGSENDLFFADPRGAEVEKIVQRVAETPAGATVVVLPEGAFINYLARRRNPTPYHDLLIWSMLLHGDDVVTSRLRDAAPDYFVIIPKKSLEYGYEGMGVDYAVPLTRWISENYVVLPTEPSPFPIRLLKRK